MDFWRISTQRNWADTVMREKLVCLLLNKDFKQTANSLRAA